MADRKSLIVVEGEAPESDSDGEICTTSGRTVSGEASETDSEGEVVKPTTFPHHSLSLAMHCYDNVSITQQSPATPECTAAPLHGSCVNSLLQQKLHESNVRLCADVSHSMKQVYLGTARDVKAATVHLSHSQGVIISTLHAVRVAMDDLGAVCDKIDIITSCRLLPDIAIATASTPTPCPQ